VAGPGRGGRQDQHGVRRPDRQHDHVVPTDRPGPGERRDRGGLLQRRRQPAVCEHDVPGPDAGRLRLRRAAGPEPVQRRLRAAARRPVEMAGELQDGADQFRQQRRPACTRGATPSATWTSTSPASSTRASSFYESQSIGTPPYNDSPTT
jgi:hypothetical protein